MFNLKANLIQNTGKNWNNVKLIFSPFTPNEGVVKPELQTNWIRFKANNVNFYRLKSKIFDSNESSSESDGLAYSNAIVNQNNFNTTFETISTYTIPSDNKTHQVELTQFEDKANFNYSVVSKLSNDVYITAKLLGNDLINQMNAEANVFADGKFVGKTYISQSANNMLEITLAKDKRIQVERIKLKEMSSKPFFGGS